MRDVPKNEKILAEFTSEERKSMKIVFWRPKGKYINACITKSSKNKSGEWERHTLYLFKEDLAALGKLIPEVLADWPELDESSYQPKQQELPPMPLPKTTDDDIPF